MPQKEFINEFLTPLDATLDQKLLEPTFRSHQILPKVDDNVDFLIKTPQIPSRFPTPYLLFAGLSASFTMSINMLHYMTINLPEAELKSFVNQSYLEHYSEGLSERGMLTLWGFLVGVPMAVAALGAASVNFFAEKFGRKFSLFFIHNAIVITSCLLCFLAKTFNAFELLIAGRLLFGISYGFSLTLVGIYNTECSPPQFRGLVGSFIGFVAMVKLMFYGVLCMPFVLGGEDQWPYIFVVGIVLGMVSIICAFFLPESPKYTYIKRRDKTRAIRDIMRLHGPGADIQFVLKSYDEEMNQTNDIAATSGTSRNTSLRHILQRRHLRKGLLIGIAAILIRAFCGYEIFAAHGTKWIATAFEMTPHYAQYVMMGIAVMQIVPPVITPLFIDRVKFRTLFLSLALIMIIINIIFVISIECYNAFSHQFFAYIGALALVSNQLLFLFGITPIGLILCSVVTSQNVRSKCVSISYTFYYLGCFMHWFGFPIVHDLIGSCAILVLAVLPSALLLLYLYRNMPETKGLPVNQIIEKWMDKADLELLKKSKDSNID